MNCGFRDRALFGDSIDDWGQFFVDSIRAVPKTVWLGIGASHNHGAGDGSTLDRLV